MTKELCSLPAGESIASRRSIRQFLDRPVALDTVAGLLALASRAPSGSNIQPWRVHVLAGAARERLSGAILAALDGGERERHRRAWNYYPQRWREPFVGRRRKVGWELYGLLGIGRGDHEASEAYRRRNYDFFGAPVGMIFTLDEDLEIGSWLDLGIFLGSLMIAARGAGLDTCAQAAFADFHEIIRETLRLPANEIVICGMALGHADDAAPVNRLTTERAAPHEFATFSGFE